MKEQKILFFDIDGTLLTAPPFSVPESAQLALKGQRKRASALCKLRAYPGYDLPFDTESRI